jgi:endonuclease YncB( thermonuclease family)
MKSKNLLLLLLLLILSVSINAQMMLKGQVTDVIDGKTLVITTLTNTKITVQLKSIEVPESNQPLSDVVKEHLRQIAIEQKVDYSVEGLTKSTLVLGKVFANGIDLSQQMIRDGAAWYNLPEESSYSQDERNLYKETETQAKNEKRGIWGVSGLKPSWEHRAELEAKRIEQEKLAAEKLAQEEIDREAARKSSRQTDEERKKANENIRVWADVYGNGSSKDFETNYDSEKNTTSFKSQPISLLSPELTDKDSMSLDLTHSFTGKDAKTAANDYYIFDVTLKSDTFDLSAAKKGNKLVFSIGANKYTLEFLGYKTTTVPASKDTTNKISNKQQMLSFKMSKKDFQTFIKATEVDFELNVFKGTIAGVDMEVIRKVP